MNYKESLSFTFDPKIKNLITIISQEDCEKFKSLTGRDLVFSKKKVLIDGETLPNDPQDFTFSLIRILSKKKKWESLDEKEKAEKFYEFFWERIQNLPVKKKKILLEILECIIKDKKIKEHSVIKNGELVDISGVDFSEACFENQVEKKDGRILWKKNTKVPSLYSYI